MSTIPELQPRTSVVSAETEYGVHTKHFALHRPDINLSARCLISDTDLSAVDLCTGHSDRVSCPLLVALCTLGRLRHKVKPLSTGASR